MRAIAARDARRIVRLLAASLVMVLVATGCNLQLLGAPRGSFTLHARFADVQGLVVGNSVQINSVVVGSVTKMQLDPRSFQAKVTMSLENGRKVPADASATIRQTTLLGEYYVDLAFPIVTGPRKYLVSGASLANTSETPAVEDVVGKAGELLSAVNANDLSAIVSAGSQALGGRGQELHDLLAKSSQLLAAFGAQNQQIGTAVDNVGQLGATLAPISDQLGQLLDSVASATTLLTKDRDRFFTALHNFDTLISTTNDVVIAPHEQQFTQLVTEANAVAGTLNQNQQVLKTFVDNLSMAAPRFLKVVSKGQILTALWAELPTFATR